MATHATASARHHHPTTTTRSWAVPLALGALFGFYAGYLHRTGVPVSWWDVLYGFVAGVVFTALAYGLGRIQGRLPRELRAGAYGALCGVAIGFLHSLTGDSVLASAGMGLMFGLAMVVVSFYVFYQREP
ncbi:hypothetical protein ACFVIM_24620 [Streptomyces sp. NPDC057638]|uniref:hypothetical protein n=1 Tax=Streptomyces sp. NPDC057638 TaxID=3346190 RepID=UPI0036C1C17D